VIIKQFGAVDYIDFSPEAPYNFAATCSVRVQVFNPVTKLVLKNFSTFQKEAHGGTFKKDGRLLVAGDDEGKVRLFDTSTKTMLRIFKGHRAPVHRAFFTLEGFQMCSFSDDKTVKLWDIATERAVNTFDEHADYVRAGAINPVSAHTILSGGYDQVIKMYDTRANKCVMTLNHGSPVGSLVFLPTGGIFVSAGGTDIKIWDVVAGGRQLTKISQHTKAVTCLQVTADGKHLISGSLDRHVRFFNTASYQLTHNIDYTNSVMSLGVSRDNNTLAVGQVDGTLVVQRREQKHEDAKTEKMREKKRLKRNNRAADEFVQVFRRDKETNYDVSLKKFEYSKALDQVLVKNCVNKTPEVTVAVIQELIRRQALTTSFQNRTQDSIAKILTFFNKYISEGRFTRVLIDATNIFLDVYESSFLSLVPAVQKLIIELNRRIRQEEQVTLEFLNLEGSLEMIMNAAAAVKDVQMTQNEIAKRLQPSDSATAATAIKV